MATIGLDKLYYAKITEDTSGNETYEDPLPLAKAMTAELSVELAEATLYADDGAAEVVKEFQSGTLTLGVDDIGKSVAEDLTGAVIDENGVLLHAGVGGVVLGRQDALIISVGIQKGFGGFPGFRALLAQFQNRHSRILLNASKD